CVDASAALAAVERAGRLPVVVGGTGLYFKALTRGLAAVPPIPVQIRSAVRERLEREGIAALYAELSDRDGASARRLSPGARARARLHAVVGSSARARVGGGGAVLADSRYPASRPWAGDGPCRGEPAGTTPPTRGGEAPLPPPPHPGLPSRAGAGAAGGFPPLP